LRKGDGRGRNGGERRRKSEAQSDEERNVSAHRFSSMSRRLV
jgi:hypothetical protein